MQEAPVVAPKGPSRMELQAETAQLRAENSALREELAEKDAAIASYAQSLADMSASSSAFTSGPDDSVASPNASSTSSSSSSAHADSPRLGPTTFTEPADRLWWLGKGQDWLTGGLSVESRLGKLYAQVNADYRAADLQAQIELTFHAHEHSSHLESEAAQMDAEAAANAGLICNLHFEVHRLQDALAAAAEAGNAAMTMLSAQAPAAEAPVSLNIQLVDGAEQISQLQAEAATMRMQHADDLVQTCLQLRHELSITEQCNELLQLELDNDHQCMARAEQEATTREEALAADVAAGCQRIAQLQEDNIHLEVELATSNAEIHDLHQDVVYAVHCFADARTASGRQIDSLHKRCMQLHSQTSWLTAVAAITTRLGRRVLGAWSPV